MIIFEYKVSPAWGSLNSKKKTTLARITDDEKDNVETWFFGRKFFHTISKKDVKRVIDIINEYPGLFKIPENLEPNDVLDGDMYSFIFADGKRTNHFSGFNILDYGRRPRKNATLALRVARRIKEEILDNNDIRTMIPGRLQHWPKYRKPSSVIKI